MTFNYKHIAILCGGTLLEVYDSYLFGFLMPIINKTFLPLNNHQHFFSIIAFSIIFLVRPVSGILWGLWGDRSGKSWVFRNAILCMSLVTILMGLLPSYAQIGIFSPLLLLICRILQGVSISGELSSAVVLCYEQSSSKQRYGNHGKLYSLIFSGIVFAYLMTTFVTHYEKEYSFIWRLPFIFGGIAGVVIYLLRQRVKFAEKLYSVNLKQLFKDYYKPIIYSVLANCLVNLSWFYFSSTTIILSKSNIHDARLPIFCSIIAVVSCYLSGKILGYFNESQQTKMIFTLSISLHIIVSYFLLMSPSFHYLLAFYYAEAIISGLIFTIMPLYIISRLPVQYRNSIYTISVNVSTAFIVGLLPILINGMLSFYYFNVYLLLIGMLVISASAFGKFKLSRD